VAGYDPALNGAQGGFFLIGTPAVLPPATVVQRGYLFGLIMSGGGSQILTVNSGQAASDDFSTLMTLSSTYTKNFTAWTVGSGNGGLDTGSIATNTWYHIYLIQRLDTNVVDVLISASASAPTLPANYTVKRRIGSIKTDATPNIIAFTQHGDEFYFNTPAALDINGTAMPTGSRTLITVQVPLGVVVKWIGAAEVAATASSGAFLLLTDPAAADVAPGDTATPLSSAGMLNGGSSNSRVFGFPRNIWTNTSAQIGARGSNSNAYWVQTYGWLDTRGKLQ
jgi:hypothetical protein